MIEHSIKFERPLVNAVLIGGANTQPADQPQTDAPPTSGDSANQQQLELIEQQSRHLEGLLNQVSREIQQFGALIESKTKQFQTLAVQMAAMMVKRTVGTDRESLLLRIEHSLSQSLARPETAAKVFFNDEDFKALDERLDKISTPSEIELLTDPRLPAGEIRVDLGNHDLVSDFETQMSHIESRLMEMIHGD